MGRQKERKLMEQPAVLHARQLVAGALKCSIELITDDTSMESTPLWDSLGHMSIILALEQDLGRALSAEEIASIATVADIARIIGGPNRI